MSNQGNLASLFFRAAAAHPEREALVLSSASLSYAQLEASVLRLASQVDPSRDGPHCGILAQRSETAFAGVLAVLAAGCAYVPLNPTFPAVRNRDIAEKARLRTLIVGPECTDALAQLLATNDAAYRIVTLDEVPAVRAIADAFPNRIYYEHAASTLPLSAAKALAYDAVAYVLFTSGSTGKPKGVVVRHRNVQRYVQNFLALYPIQPHDRVSQTFDLTFDLSVHDMFVTWAAGATLVVYPSSVLARPVAYTQAQRVSVWFSVPSLAVLLDGLRQAEAGALPGVRLSLFCGEKLTWNTWRYWRSLAPGSRVVNLYGPTETTIAITHFEVPNDFPERAALGGVIPIGLPLPGQGLHISRADGSRCEAGETGALWLGGDQVSAGYLDEPSLSAQRFAAHSGETRYHTGDLVLRDAAGCAHFVGREDNQVKIMGYRVELGEIEHALLRVTGAAQVIADVIVRDGVEELFAVLPQALSDQKKSIGEALASMLPGYMLPRRYVFVSSLPCNASGKVDRAAVRKQVLQAQRP